MEELIPQYALELQRAVKETGLGITEAAKKAGLNRSTFGNIYRGERKTLDRINPAVRKKIYDAFRIECFKLPYFNETEDSPRAQLKRYIIEKYEGQISRFADSLKVRNLKVSKYSIAHFLRGDTLSFKGEQKQAIYEGTGLQCFAPVVEAEILQTPLIQTQLEAKVQEELNQEPIQERMREEGDITSRLANIERDLGAIKTSLAGKLSSNQAIKILGTNYKPNSQERMQVVEKAIDFLVEQMDYFKESSQEEREALIIHLREANEIDRWGYVVNLLNNISKSGNTPDTFVRSLDSPKKRRKK